MFLAEKLLVSYFCIISSGLDIFALEAGQEYLVRCVFAVCVHVLIVQCLFTLYSLLLKVFQHPAVGRSEAPQRLSFLLGTTDSLHI